MGVCNDPRCSLNRQGVPHEDHETIESKPVTNPCNDPRCAMNRMGIRHDIHEEKTNNTQKHNKSNNQIHTENNGVGSFDDALRELSKRLNKDNPNKLSREKVLEERRKRERQAIEQEAQEEIAQKNNLQEQKEHPFRTSSIFSRSNRSETPSINQILNSNDPYVTFNITPDTTCDEIKSKYRELSRNYNASRGSVNRTREEQELLTRTQIKIINAYDFLKRKHCG